MARNYKAAQWAAFELQVSIGILRCAQDDKFQSERVPLRVGAYFRSTFKLIRALGRVSNELNVLVSLFLPWNSAQTS